MRERPATSYKDDGDASDDDSSRGSSVGDDPRDASDASDASDAGDDDGDDYDPEAEISVASDSEGDDDDPEAEISDASSSEGGGDSDSDESSDDEVEGGKRPKDSAQCGVAKRGLCVALDISIDDFVPFRQGLSYLITAIHAGDPKGVGDPEGFKAVLRSAYSLLEWYEKVSPGHLTQIIDHVHTVVDQVNVPYEEVAKVFSALANKNGGVFSTTSRHLREMFGIAMMAQMVHSLPGYIADGSAQRKGMAALLNQLGLHGDAGSVLVDELPMDTPMSRAEAEVKKIVEGLNGCDDVQRMSVVFGQLAMFTKIGNHLPKNRPAADGKGGYDRSLYDDLRTRNAKACAKSSFTVRLSLSAVVRDPKGPAHADALVAVQEAQGVAVDATRNYPPLKYFREEIAVPQSVMLDIADRARTAFPNTQNGWLDIQNRLDFQREKEQEYRSLQRKTVDKAHGEMVVPLRAETRVRVPTPGSAPLTLVRALRSLLVNHNAEHKLLAPLLKTYLDKAHSQHRNTKWGFNTSAAFLGLRFNSVELKVGRLLPKARTGANEVKSALYGDGKVPKWICMHDVGDAELANLIPPWCAHEPGTWEFFLYLADTAPPTRFFGHHLIRKEELAEEHKYKKWLLARAARAAREDTALDYCYALNNGNAKRRKLSHDEKLDSILWQESSAAIAVAEKKLSAAYTEPFEPKKKVVLIAYPVGVFRDYDPRSLSAARGGRPFITNAKHEAAVADRIEKGKRANAYFAAMATNDATARAEIGGADYHAGSASFAAAAGSSSVAEP